MGGEPHRKKVTLALDNVSVTDALYTMFDQGLRAKFIEFPSAVYSMHPFDRVTVDATRWPVYVDRLQRQRRQDADVAMLDERHAVPAPKWRSCGASPTAVRPNPRWSATSRWRSRPWYRRCHTPM